MTTEGQGFKGRKVTVTWKGEPILGVRERSLQLAGEPVNLTSGDDDGWRLLADDNGPAQDNVDFNASGVTKSSRLKDDWFSRERTGELIITYPTGHQVSGTAVLVNYSDTGPYNDAMTFEAAWQYSGPVVFDYALS
jgi:predicted secreted protein